MFGTQSRANIGRSEMLETLIKISLKYLATKIFIAAGSKRFETRRRRSGASPTFDQANDFHSKSISILECGEFKREPGFWSCTRVRAPLSQFIGNSLVVDDRRWVGTERKLSKFLWLSSGILPKAA